jgi:hypothetical protein
VHAKNAGTKSQYIVFLSNIFPKNELGAVRPPGDRCAAFNRRPSRRPGGFAFGILANHRQLSPVAEQVLKSNQRLLECRAANARWLT